MSSNETSTDEKSVPTSDIDPTYRVSILKAANTKLHTVAPTDTIQQAVTLMLAHNFSQLPVMVNERDVKGIISWSSIGTRLALGKNGESVREMMEPHYQEIRADAYLFHAVPIIVAHEYVLVRGTETENRRITGILTASDLSVQFQQLGEPFLLLDEIEKHIRQVLDNKFSTAELASFREDRDTKREIKGVQDLTFGEYKRLLDDPERWTKINLAIDRVSFGKQLDHVRQIRNSVMHFDPAGIKEEQLFQLRDFAHFLRRLRGVGAI